MTLSAICGVRRVRYILHRGNGGRDPLKLLQAKIESGPTEGRTDEAITVYGRAGHRGPAGAGGRDCDGGGLPQARGQLGDVLQVEGQVRRAGSVRGEAVEGAGGRERSAEADAGGHDAQQHRAEGSLGKKVVTPAARREAARYLRQAYEMSERRACRVIGTDRTSVRYQGVRPADNALRERLKALAEERRRFGYRRLHVLLRREGHVVNKKRVQRLYREERLTVRRRGGRKRAIGTRRSIARPLAANQRWSLDFVSDQLTDARRFRILAVVDDCTRECLALVADTSISGRRVARELDDIVRRRGQRPDDRQRQRHRADLERDPGLGGCDRRRLALHRARQTAAERLHRELQRPSSRRAAERDAVQIAAPRWCRAGGMATRLQRAATAFEARLADAWGLRQRPPRRERPGRCASLGLRAPASCHPSNRRFKSTPDSRYPWMKNGGHVKIYEYLKSPILFASAFSLLIYQIVSRL